MKPSELNIRTILIILALGLAVNCHAARMWGDRGVLAATNYAYNRPSLCPVGDMGVIAAFNCYDEDGIFRAAVQGLDAGGRLIYPNGPLFLSTPNKWCNNYNNIIAKPDNEGGAFILWQVNTEVVGFYDVFIQHLDSEGQPVWDEGGIPLFRTTVTFKIWDPNHIGFQPSEAGGFIIVEIIPLEDNPYVFNHQIRKYNADRVYRDISILDERGEMHPEAPVSVRDLIGEGTYYSLSSDSAGGGYLAYSTGAGDNTRYCIIHLNSSCQRDGEVLYRAL